MGKSRMKQATMQMQGGKGNQAKRKPAMLANAKKSNGKVPC